MSIFSFSIQYHHLFKEDKHCVFHEEDAKLAKNRRSDNILSTFTVYVKKNIVWKRLIFWLSVDVKKGKARFKEVSRERVHSWANTAYPLS